MINKLLSLWTGLTPWTKRIFIISFFLTVITLIIAAALTDNLDELFGMVEAKK